MKEATEKTNFDELISKYDEYEFNIVKEIYEKIKNKLEIDIDSGFDELEFNKYIFSSIRYITF